MNQKSSMFIIKIMGFLILLTVGCATKSDKALFSRDLQKASSLKLVRYHTPKLLKETAGSKALGVAGMMFGAVGSGLGEELSYATEEKDGKKLQEMYNLPDFGELVFKEFTELISKELTMPMSVIDEKIISDDDLNKIGGYVVVINVNTIRVTNGDGLVTRTTLKMLDPGRNIMCMKTFDYKSRFFQRRDKLDNLEVDNAGLLREEFAFAAEKTASALADHLVIRNDTN